MKTIQPATESQEPRSGQTRRRGLLVLVLSFALVAAACSSDDDSSDMTLAPTTTAAATTTAAPTATAAPTTTVAPESADGVPPQIATVEAVYDALNAHDADAYAAYWAEGAGGWGSWLNSINDQAPVGSPEMDQGFEHRRAWGAHFALSDCELADKEARYEEVRCLETWDDRVYHGMAGLTLGREAVYTFDEQGMITTMIHVNPNFDEVMDWQEEFGPWMQATYREIAETYLVPGFDRAFKREVVFASPESIAEFTGLIEEFVAQSDTYPLAPSTTTTSPESALAECVGSLVPGSSAVPCEGVVYDLGIPEECFATPCGLIVDFHPSGLTGEQTDAYTNMKALGNAAGYVVVQPDSPSSVTFAGRNRIFFDALIGALDIDVSRVHVGGASSGGTQAWRFVCNHADLIASAAPHASGTVYCDSEENRLPAEQVDILMLHGRKDSQIPFAQGVTQLEFVIGSWGMTASEVLADEPTYQWTRWTNEQGTVLEFVEFDWTTPTGEGHCYPGGVGSGGCGIDTPIHYGEAALDFYIAHPKDA